MPSNPAPKQPTNAYVVPQSVQRSTGPAEVELTTEYLARLEKRLADPVDRVLSYINSMFAPSPVAYSTSASNKLTGVNTPALVTPSSTNTLVTRGATQVGGTLTAAGAIGASGQLVGSNSVYCLMQITLAAASYGGSTAFNLPTNSTVTIIAPPMAGSVASVSVQVSSAAISAGTITAQLLTNGAATGAQAGISSSITNRMNTYSRGACPFAAGSQLYLRLTCVGVTVGSNTGICVSVYAWT